MNAASGQAHWDKVYASKRENELSWFQENPATSLDLVAKAGASTASAVIDVGGGASQLVDALIEKGFRAVTVLDLSEAALAAAKARLGRRADLVQWVVADITVWEPHAAPRGRLRRLARPSSLSLPYRGVRARGLRRLSHQGREARRTRDYRHLCAGRTRKVQRLAGCTLWRTKSPPRGGGRL